MRNNNLYGALNVAAYVVQYCHKLGTTVSNLKLQKILYFLQAEFLVSKNECCFKQQIEVWSFGPVVPAVYHEYKIYGGVAIPYIGDKDIFLVKEDKKHIDKMIEQCSKYSAADLLRITQKQKPWSDAYSPCSKNVISTKSIKEFFVTSNEI